MGINICSYDCVISKFENLSAKYIVCIVNGDVDRLCRLNGYLSIYSVNDSNVLSDNAETVILVNNKLM